MRATEGAALDGQAQTQSSDEAVGRPLRGLDCSDAESELDMDQDDPGEQPSVGPEEAASPTEQTVGSEENMMPAAAAAAPSSSSDHPILLGIGTLHFRTGYRPTEGWYGAQFVGPMLQLCRGRSVDPATQPRGVGARHGVTI